MSTGSASQTGTQRVLQFVKTTLIGGLVFLVPVTILVLLVTKVAGVLRSMARPLAAYLPVDTVFGIVVADILVILLLVLVCFLAGLLARVSFANRFIKKAETGLLWRIPGYGFIKGITDTFDHGAAASTMRPVLVHFDDAAQLAFEVDQLADGRAVVYVPSAPDPRAGSVLVMDRQRVEPMSTTFVAAISSLRSLGRGVGTCLCPPVKAS